MLLKGGTSEPSLGQTSWSIDWGKRLVCVPDLTSALDIWEYREETQKSALSASARREREARKAGGFAYVYKGILTLGNGMAGDLSVAVKVPLLVDDEQEYKYKKRFRSEAVVWYSLKHRNILPFLGIAEPPEVPNICFVSPLIANGNVRRFLTEYPSATRLPIIQGTADGLAYLHSQSVIHGDLKGANVLISDDGIPLLCDFGLATLVAEDEDAFEKSDTILQSGSRFWMAPELFRAELPGSMLSKASDVWSFAMLVMEVLTNCQPWGKRRNIFVIMEGVAAGERPERPLTQECNDALWTLISRCWDISPAQRPGITQVCTSIQQLEIKGSSAE